MRRVRNGIPTADNGPSTGRLKPVNRGKRRELPGFGYYDILFEIGKKTILISILFVSIKLVEIFYEIIFPQGNLFAKLIQNIGNIWVIFLIIKYSRDLYKNIFDQNENSH